MYENNYPNHENTYYYQNNRSFSDAGINPENNGKHGKKSKSNYGFGKKIMIGICCAAHPSERRKYIMDINT